MLYFTNNKLHKCAFTTNKNWGKHVLKHITFVLKMNLGQSMPNMVKFYVTPNITSIIQNVTACHFKGLCMVGITL